MLLTILFRERRKNTGRPKEPKRLSQLGNIPDGYKVTHDGDDFLIPVGNLNNGMSFVCLLAHCHCRSLVATGQLMVFATNRNLEILSRCSVWIMDGTFDVTPDLFYQMYTIHGCYGPRKTRRSVPLVYALMTK